MHIIDFSTHTEGPWESGKKVSRKPFKCADCLKRKPKGTAYSWVDGMRSCSVCSPLEDENDTKS